MGVAGGGCSPTATEGWLAFVRVRTDMLLTRSKSRQALRLRAPERPVMVERVSSISLLDLWRVVALISTGAQLCFLVQTVDGVEQAIMIGLVMNC